jgi:undecaprenyl-phosphate 4-deoxy-4-formamido-L-arabinose transferase
MDGSAAIITKAATDNTLQVVRVLLNRNYGQHAAVIAGLTESRGDIVITLDADLQNPPEEIPKLIMDMEQGVDVVGTVRINRRDSFFRKFSSGLVNSMVRRAIGVSNRCHDA